MNDLPSAAESAKPDVDRLRLLVALDALLVEGSVTGAARALELSTPAMSRLLSQLRAMFNDELMVRTGRGMVPTALAESLRTRIRALAEEAIDLVHPRAAPAPDVTWEVKGHSPLLQHPPLAISRPSVLEGEPDPAMLSHRLASIDEDASPWLKLGRYVSTVGGGGGRPRPLTAEEAEEALSIILDGKADPVQIGALLVAIQYRGLNVNELVGMTRAARRTCLRPGTGQPAADIDWPAYLSPRMTTPPWFLHAARLLAQGGHRVLLHGFDIGIGRLGTAIKAAGIAQVFSINEARLALDEHRIAYMPLSAIEPQLQALCSLYRLFQMRSPLNMVVQMLNPLGAAASLFGVPSSSAKVLQREAAQLLGWQNMIAVTTRRDVAQATAQRSMSLLTLKNGNKGELNLPASLAAARTNFHSGFSAMEYWSGVWSGAVNDEHAMETIVSTAAIALVSCSCGDKTFSQARAQAVGLWKKRLSANAVHSS